MLLILSFACTVHANDIHNYFWANCQQFQGNKQEAQEWYNTLLSGERPSIYTNKGYIHFLNDKGDFGTIVKLMPKVEKIFEKDPDMQLIFAQSLKKTGAPKQADERTVRLVQTFPTHPEIVFQAAETMVRNKEHTNALTIVDDFLNSASRRPNHFIFHFLKGQIYSQLGNYQKARESVQACLDAHPRFPQGWLLLSLIEEHAGKLDQAIKGYTSYLEVSGRNRQVEQHLIALTLKQRASTNNRTVLVLNKNCFDKAMILFSRGQYKEALNQLNICLSNNPKDVQLRLFKVQILTAMQEYQQAIDILTQWSIQEPTTPIWPQTLHLLPRTKKIPVAQVIKAFEKIQQEQPKNPIAALYLSDVYLRAGEQQKGLVQMTRTLDLVGDPTIRMRIAYQIALIYYDKGQHENMAKILETAQKLNIDYAPALNLMAYYYTTDKHNYDKAQALIEKALELDPHNPHFKDTKAWVLYKQGEYRQSLALLQDVIEQVPHDSTVLIHLAKVQKKLGNSYNALNIMNHAQRHAHNTYEKRTTENLLKEWTV